MERMAKDQRQTRSHPATFSKELYATLRHELVGAKRVLDPFAGTGVFLDLLDDGAVGTGVEIEGDDWEGSRPGLVRGDSRNLVAMFGRNAFDAVVSSPCYPNGVTDNFNAGAKTQRTHHYNTYRFRLGRPLTPGSLAGCGRGLTKRHNDGHEEIAKQIVQVLEPGGKLIWNCKDVIKNKELVPVVDWWANLWTDLGLDYVHEYEIKCPGIREGANRDARADTESVLVFTKAA